MMELMKNDEYEEEEIEEEVSKSSKLDKSGKSNHPVKIIKSDVIRNFILISF